MNSYENLTKGQASIGQYNHNTIEVDSMVKDASAAQLGGRSLRNDASQAAL